MRLALWIAVIDQAMASTAIVNYAPDLIQRTSGSSNANATLWTAAVTGAKVGWPAHWACALCDEHPCVIMVLWRTAAYLCTASEQSGIAGRPRKPLSACLLDFCLLRRGGRAPASQNINCPTFPSYLKLQSHTTPLPPTCFLWCHWPPCTHPAIPGDADRWSHRVHVPGGHGGQAAAADRGQRRVRGCAAAAGHGRPLAQRRAGGGVHVHLHPVLLRQLRRRVLGAAV